MKDTFQALMARVTQLTRTGKLREATAAIQRALGGTAAAPPSRAPASDAAVIDVQARVVAPAQVRDAVVVESFEHDSSDVLLREREPTARTAEPTARTAEPAARPVEPAARPVEPPARPRRGRFISGSFTNHAGTRDYKLYVPGAEQAQALPLLVMLHGCKQDPDDFATGTRMNELAELTQCLVLYPAQRKSANGAGCWNWFNDADQRRDRGEPSMIAGMTRMVIETYPIDARRVYVAGLSAGGAMAAIMGTTYPELYAAVGVHSGLPHAAAHDVISAFAAMRKGPAATRARPLVEAGPVAPPLPTIVFHGDRDATVHPSNGEHVISRATPVTAGDGAADAAAAQAPVSVEQGRASGGRAYTRTVHRDANGRAFGIEHWLVHGAGHAWSGGNASGSFTDPKGPDASREMLRFFLEHPKP